MPILAHSRAAKFSLDDFAVGAQRCARKVFLVNTPVHCRGTYHIALKLTQSGLGPAPHGRPVYRHLYKRAYRRVYGRVYGRVYARVYARVYGRVYRRTHKHV